MQSFEQKYGVKPSMAFFEGVVITLFLCGLLALYCVASAAEAAI